MSCSTKSRRAREQGSGNRGLAIEVRFRLVLERPEFRLDLARFDTSVFPLKILQ
jgi:hypothetical protein